MQNLNGTLSALAHPVRRGVLARLQHGETPVSDLVRSLRISGPALTRHLHVLERAGLITRSRSAQQRPCRLSLKPLIEMDTWIESYRRFWIETADRLDEHLKTMKAKKTLKTRKSIKPEGARKHGK
jgi:DNA-binding transcriptional ArsR family regulator